MPEIDLDGPALTWRELAVTVIVVAALMLGLLFVYSRTSSAAAFDFVPPSWAFASAYSTADSPGPQGCTGRPLRDDTLTFASFAVPCGARVRFCVGRRCVTAKRTDSGPFVIGRSFDLALGTVRALGFGSAIAFGVRPVSWKRVG